MYGLLGYLSVPVGSARGRGRLTIDDGPHPAWTPRMLDVLRRAGPAGPRVEERHRLPHGHAEGPPGRLSPVQETREGPRLVPLHHRRLRAGWGSAREAVPDRPGSAGRRRRAATLGRLHTRVAYQRRDGLRKLTTRLTTSHDGVVVEDLHVAGLEDLFRLWRAKPKPHPVGPYLRLPVLRADDRP